MPVEKKIKNKKISLPPPSEEKIIRNFNSPKLTDKRVWLPLIIITLALIILDGPQSDWLAVLLAIGIIGYFMYITD